MFTTLYCFSLLRSTPHLDAIISITHAALLVPIHSHLMSVLFVLFCPLFGHLNEHPSRDTLPVCAWIDLAALLSPKS
jgi:hypothetical protein